MAAKDIGSSIRPNSTGAVNIGPSIQSDPVGNSTEAENIGSSMKSDSVGSRATGWSPELVERSKCRSERISVHE